MQARWRNPKSRWIAARCVIVANVPNELIHAATWDSGLVGLVSRDKVDTIRSAMIGLVEEFAEDYQTVNPK